MSSHVKSPLRVAAGKAIIAKRTAPGSPEHVEAEREFAAIRIRTYAARIVAAAPPLTEMQIDEIAAIIRGGAR